MSNNLMRVLIFFILCLCLVGIAWAPIGNTSNKVWVDKEELKSQSDTIKYLKFKLTTLKALK